MLTSRKLALAILAIGFSLLGLAVVTGNISGVVKDSSQAPVDHADIVATETATNFMRRVVFDVTSRYEIPWGAHFTTG